MVGKKTAGPKPHAGPHRVHIERTTTERLGFVYDLRKRVFRALQKQGLTLHDLGKALGCSHMTAGRRLHARTMEEPEARAICELVGLDLDEMMKPPTGADAGSR